MYSIIIIYIIIYFYFIGFIQLIVIFVTYLFYIYIYTKNMTNKYKYTPFNDKDFGIFSLNFFGSSFIAILEIIYKHILFN